MSKDKPLTAREILENLYDYGYTAAEYDLKQTALKPNVFTIDTALSQLQNLLESEMIGEDEVEGVPDLPQKFARNELKAEQRKKLKEIFGGSDE